MMDQPATNDVDQLLLNARLRDELEPYLDESIELLPIHQKPTRFENEYLASMLAWERAPILPIAEWFQPQLDLPHPDALSPLELRQLLLTTMAQLRDKRIILEFTDHLSDRELYCLIIRDILPSPEKKLETQPTYLHWHCLDPQEDPDTWLRYYATSDERLAWQRESGQPLPEAEDPPWRRQLPRRAK